MLKHSDWSVCAKLIGFFFYFYYFLFLYLFYAGFFFFEKRGACYKVMNKYQKNITHIQAFGSYLLIQVYSLHVNLSKFNFRTSIILTKHNDLIRMHEDYCKCVKIISFGFDDVWIRMIIQQLRKKCNFMFLKLLWVPDKQIFNKKTDKQFSGGKKQSDGCFYINSAFCQVNSHTGVNT